MQASPIRKLIPLANEAKRQGKKVYHLNIGQPDIETPSLFFEAIEKHKEAVLAYAPSEGLEVVRKSFSRYYTERGISLSPEEIIVTNGGSEAILFALVAICDPGDEIIVPEPFYTNYNGFAAAVNVKVVPLTTKAEDGFHIPSKEALESLITSRTRAMLLSNPGNPTGVVYTEEEMNWIAELSKKHDFWILADEVYREFTYSGTAKSFLQIPGIEDRVVIVDSISKRYSACGARIGSLGTKNREFLDVVLKLCQGRLCVPTLEQIGAAALVDTPKSYFETVIKEYQARRDVVFQALSEMEGVICREPQGAFYVIAKLPVEDGEDFVRFLISDFDLDGETTLLAPAEGFYGTPGLGKDEVRISYCLCVADCEKAMEIVKEGLKAYLKKSGKVEEFVSV